MEGKLRSHTFALRVGVPEVQKTAVSAGPWAPDEGQGLRIGLVSLFNELHFGGQHLQRKCVAVVLLYCLICSYVIKGKPV